MVVEENADALTVLGRASSALLGEFAIGLEDRIAEKCIGEQVSFRWEGITFQIEKSV